VFHRSGGGERAHVTLFTETGNGSGPGGELEKVASVQGKVLLNFRGPNKDSVLTILSVAEDIWSIY
jgi:hypothetical protein